MFKWKLNLYVTSATTKHLINLLTEMQLVISATRDDDELLLNVQFATRGLKPIDIINNFVLIHVRLKHNQVAVCLLVLP